MDRGQRSIMSGVHCLQHVKRLTPTHLADYDALGPHTEAVSYQVPGRYFALAFDIWRSGLQSNNVRLLQLQFGRVLDRDDSLIFRNVARENVQQRRRAGAGAAGNNDVHAPLDDGRENLGNFGRHGVQFD